VERQETGERRLAPPAHIRGISQHGPADSGHPFVTVDSAATDPTALTFRHKDPAGTLAAFVWGTDAELVRESTGTFHVDLIVAASGRHHYRWEATGSAHGVEETTFDVRTSNVI